MASNEETTAAVTNTAGEYGLSSRGITGMTYRDFWSRREQTMADPWSPTNPSNTVILSLAENSLMHKDIGEYLKNKIQVLPLNHLTYSTGPRGSRRLRQAAASYWTSEFNSQVGITADNIFITPGVASALDSLAWSFCNDGDVIMAPLPLYNGFIFDTMNRSNAHIIGVRYQHLDGYGGIDDLFSPSLNEIALEAAI
ncbi:hypothetical protein QQS21_000360 [Conoideocrella luteorostrata]|uniref:1-aminocyclopropane-1-carboxylate synthase n=1 Tax=Conoideocrella luteorostrata TaxID=1105319 RepID=A0AAJ0G442_9HYPO|nr:hypothetical protein QQS21_000360 [Conoideocrella luteorostrata]